MLNRHAIAARIKLLRGEVSQRDFGKLLGYRQTIISEIETGRVKPSVEFLLILSEKCNVSVDWILKGDRPQALKNSNPMIAIDRIREFLRVTEEKMATDSIRGLQSP